jgi:peptidoglycan/xylan/chitin deacetylase (PgdA/CDA1 family)
MRHGLRCIATSIGVLAVVSTASEASPCAGRPDALGVSRVITIGAKELPTVGMHDYGRTLPLAEGEVVLTFDDGPKSPYTEHVLKTLASECVRAVFFLVGKQANERPDLVRQIQAAGHTIGTHTQNHPLRRMSHDQAAREIETGILSVGAALGDARAVAPFFRFPGLFRTDDGERYLRTRSIMAWSIDVDTSDWKRIGLDRMLQHTFAQLESRRGGIVLMHDIQPKTALVLPRLLAELRSRGYRIVHVVPADRLPLPDVAQGPVTEPSESTGSILPPRLVFEPSSGSPSASPFERVVTPDGSPMYR